jgi:hypothetical protein
LQNDTFAPKRYASFAEKMLFGAVANTKKVNFGGFFGKIDRKKKKFSVFCTLARKLLLMS